MVLEINIKRWTGEISKIDMNMATDMQSNSKSKPRNYEQIKHQDMGSTHMEVCGMGVIADMSLSEN